MYEGQEETGRGYGNQMGLGGNLVPEGNVPEGGDIQNNMGSNGLPAQTGSDNSFDKYMANIHDNPKFSEKERQFSQKIDNFIRSKTGKPISAFSGYIFMANKILLLSTLTEFLFQRFDVITLLLNLVIIANEVGIFSNKHIYKWLIVLIASLLLDALVLIDISPAGETYLESGAGSTMLKFGLLLVLANIFLKLFIGIGLWKMAMEFKSSRVKSSVNYDEEKINDGDPNNISGQNDLNDRQGRIFPTTDQNKNDKFQLRGSREEDDED